MTDSFNISAAKLDMRTIFRIMAEKSSAAATAINDAGEIALGSEDDMISAMAIPLDYLFSPKNKIMMAGTIGEKNERIGWLVNQGILEWVDDSDKSAVRPDRVLSAKIVSETFPHACRFFRNMAKSKQSHVTSMSAKDKQQAISDSVIGLIYYYSKGFYNVQEEI
ncbi:hypothetical protein [Morganella phage Mecenats66]|nr:hypothetical protein [Morganella phage Mecenats66]